MKAAAYLGLLLMISLLSLPFVESANATVAYRSNTGVCASNDLNCPKIRAWDSTGRGSWGSEVELPTAGSPVRYAVIRFSNVSGKRVLVTSSDDGFLDGYVSYNNTDWTVTNNLGQVFGSNAAKTERRFDLQFETATGDAVLVYATTNSSGNCDLAYKVLLASDISWANSGELCIDNDQRTQDDQFSWINLDRNPSDDSQELIMNAFNTNLSDITARVWNGNTWGNRINLTSLATACAGGQCLDVAYAKDGSKAMAVGADSTSGNVSAKYWNGASWVTTPGFDIDSSDALDLKWISLKADTQTDDLQAVFVDSGSDLGTAYWNGATWTVTSNIDAAVDSNAARPADFAWNSSTAEGKLVLDTDTTGTTLSQRGCAPQCTSSTTTFSTYAGTGAWVSLYRVPSDPLTKVGILGIRLNANFDIGSFAQGLNGSYYTYNDSVITIDTTVTTFEAYSLAFQIATTPLTVAGPPNVTHVQALPSKVENNSRINITANVTCSGCSIDTVLARIYGPNGSLYVTLPMVNVFGTIYQNATFNVTAYPFGNYWVNITANHTGGATNSSETTVYSPYVTLNQSQEVVVDNSTKEWTNLSKIQDEDFIPNLGGASFNITQISLTNGPTRLFAYIQLEGGLNFSAGNYYRLFVTNNESNGKPTTPDTNTTLPFNYTRIIQLNNSKCRVFNTLGSKVGNCHYYNNSDTLEIEVSLKYLNVTKGESLNVTFETGNWTHSFDFAPNNNSYLQFLINQTKYNIHNLTNDTYENYTTDFIYPTNSSFSVELWMKTNVSEDQTFISSGEYENLQSWWKIGMEVGENTSLYVRIQDNQEDGNWWAIPDPSADQGQIYGQKPLDDNEWHHIVVLRDKEQKTISGYVDATLDLNFTDATSSITDSATHLILAESTLQSYENFNGQLVVIGVYNRALTPEEITEHYQTQDPEMGGGG